MTQSVTMKQRRKVRLLPIVIIMVTALLVVRLGEMAFGVELSPASPALAQENKDEDAPKVKKEVAADKSKGVPKDEPPSIDFPVEFTPGEVAVLQALADRRDGLIEQEKELDARERLLGAAEGRLDKRIGELQQLRDSIEALVRQFDEQEKAELLSIVKIYETMKPQDAAVILEELEMPLLLSIVEAMKERKSAALLAAMGPARAREITTEMAREREIDLSAQDTKTKPSS